MSKRLQLPMLERLVELRQLREDRAMRVLRERVAVVKERIHEFRQHCAALWRLNERVAAAQQDRAAVLKNAAVWVAQIRVRDAYIDQLGVLTLVQRQTHGTAQTRLMLAEEDCKAAQRVASAAVERRREAVRRVHAARYAIEAGRERAREEAAVDFAARRVVNLARMRALTTEGLS